MFARPFADSWAGEATRGGPGRQTGGMPTPTGGDGGPPPHVTTRVCVRGALSPTRGCIHSWSRGPRSGTSDALSSRWRGRGTDETMTRDPRVALSILGIATTACSLRATTPKPGQVDVELIVGASDARIVSVHPP